jgi:hypothetical protein
MWDDESDELVLVELPLAPSPLPELPLGELPAEVPLVVPVSVEESLVESPVVPEEPAAPPLELDEDAPVVHPEPLTGSEPDVDGSSPPTPSSTTPDSDEPEVVDPDVVEPEVVEPEVVEPEVVEPEVVEPDGVEVSLAVGPEVAGVSALQSVLDTVPARVDEPVAA